MHYDLASKVLLSRCKEPFLSYFCGLPVKDALLVEEKPQETPSLRRSDFLLRVRLEDGGVLLALVEFISRWRAWYPVRTLECRCRHLLKENLPIRSFLVLLTPSVEAHDLYEDEEVRYRFGLVKLYEMEARMVLEEGPPCLLAFVPLMKGGEEMLDEAERKIYELEAEREWKADLLTGMAILGGLKSPEIPLKLIERRRDLMIESAAYEIIKKEGFEEGLKQGIQQGLEKGIQQGIQQGIRRGLLEAIELGLKLRFGAEGLRLLPEMAKVEEVERLRAIKEALEVVKSPEELRKFLS